ncbi:translation initiation factor IF-2 subunit alpha [Candidatus Woesearchaeota archaeon]|nr:MAG: translation initiation factor IF-2 subunit alpha [Candidatus Woesearchaeota archaeon ex4484_78]RLE46116.1 MAG: translation initiation factor IF-2 subunit alpha [Candidatus Woesearchaeota archaeon]
MLLKKEGFPEEEELVLCTVTGVNPHSVFVTLDEYGGRTGMIHISEVAPGRIRNIREYVQEGKKVVCKVLQINKEKGYIDLSLRRVNKLQKRSKLNEIKEQQLSEKIIEQVAKQQKTDGKKLYKELTEKLLKKYETLYAAFEDIAKGDLNPEKILEDKKTAKLLTTTIKQRVKPPEVILKGEITLSTYAPAGIQDIKETLHIAEKEGAKVRYLGAGNYDLELKSTDYKIAEKKLEKIIDKMTKFSETKKIKFKFTRKETD